MRHHLQKSILDKLATAENMRYADLNAQKLDGNVFTYHLKQLIIDKLIIQNDDKSYSLTASGRAYIVHRYENSAESAHSIFLVIIRHNDKLLLRRRLVQPMLGYSGFIHGEPVFDEPIELTVANRVKDKSGLKTNHVEVVGSGLIRMSVNGEQNNFSHAILVTASVKDDEMSIRSDETGENYWIDETSITAEANILKSCTDLLEISGTRQGWFDLKYDL